MTALVTGAQGFIGARLAELLLERGEGVVTLQRDVHPLSRFASEGIGERCALVTARLCDHAALVRALHEHEVTSVYHLASHSIVEAANRSPLPTWEANVRGTYSGGLGVVCAGAC